MNEYGGRYHVGDTVVLVENTYSDYNYQGDCKIGDICVVTSIHSFNITDHSRIKCYYFLSNKDGKNTNNVGTLEEQMTLYENREDILTSVSRRKLNKITKQLKTLKIIE